MIQEVIENLDLAFYVKLFLIGGLFGVFCTTTSKKIAFSITSVLENYGIENNKESRKRWKKLSNIILTTLFILVVFSHLYFHLFPL
jgi:hypothetical protein